MTTNPGKTVLYTGVTNNLKRRISEHFNNRGNKKTFAGKYYCYNLIYFEQYPIIIHAIQREKEIRLLEQDGGNLGMFQIPVNTLLKLKMCHSGALLAGIL